MPIIAGPELDEIQQELVDWYLDTEKWLIKALEEGGYPYGSVGLTPAQQLQKFAEMTPEEWRYMEGKLMERHRGQPNQRELVEADLKDYTSRMLRMMGGARNA